jgi:hypothetical protein
MYLSLAQNLSPFPLLLGFPQPPPWDRASPGWPQTHNSPASVPPSAGTTSMNYYTQRKYNS